MKNKGIKERNPEEKNLVKLELDALVRHGAQEILAKALEIELAGSAEHAARRVPKDRGR